tara:strand:- start:1291 stop:3159 length:1869 start_codon:yes stop_codon:yes gene_type:complete
MAKLYGTADPTLAAAAFRHGESMVPGDMKDIYQQRADNVKSFGEGIKKMFDGVYADNKNTMDLLNDNASKALDIMEAGEVPNDHAIEMHGGVVGDYKDRLKAINAEYGMGKGGDLERSKLRSEMNRYLSNIENSESIYQNIVKNAANSRLLNDLGDDKAKLFNLVLEDRNNGTSIAKSSYENGEIVYSVPGSNVKLSMREMQEGMSAHDPKYLNGVQQKLTSFQAKGKAKGGAMTEDDALRFKNELQTSITSWDEIRNVSQEKFGKMKFTFEEVLTGQATNTDGSLDTDALELIYSELESLGGIDIDNDGDVDDDDKNLLSQARKNGEIYTDIDNGFTLIDALKKDKQKYRDVMANYLTETAVKDFYGQGAAQFKGSKNGVIKNGKNKSDLSLLKSNKSTELFGKNNGWTNNGSLNSLGTTINDRKNIPLAEGEGEIIWDKNAKTYIYKPTNGENQIINDKNSLFQTFFQSADPISSTTLQGKWWNSIKEWGSSSQETATPIKNLKDLKTAGVDRNIFMKPADEVIDNVKAVLPEGYDVITEKSGWGKKGDWTPFFRSEDQFIVTDANGDKVGEFDTNYFKTPSKAIDELNRFFKVLSEKNALNINTEANTGANAGINEEDI